MGRYLLEFDILRRQAEAKVATRGALPDGFVSISRMQKAALPSTSKSLLMASVQGSLDFPRAAKQMRRLSDRCGVPSRQEVLAATEMDAKSGGGDLSYDAPAANRRAKSKRGGIRVGY